MAARYRKIDPRIWKDENFLKLSSEEKLITIYSFTAQSNRIGIFSFSPGEAIEDLGTFREGSPKPSPKPSPKVTANLRHTFKTAFEKVIQTLSWRWDSGVRVLYIPTWWKYNCPENPNVLKACLSDVHDIPQTPLLVEFSDNLLYLPETFHQTFREGLPQPLYKPSPQPSPQPSPNQEQEQDQKQEKEREPAAPSLLTFGEFGWTRLTEDQHRKLLVKMNGSFEGYSAAFDRWVNEAPDAKANGVRRRDRHAYESISAWFDRDLKAGKVKPQLGFMPAKPTPVC